MRTMLRLLARGTSKTNAIEGRRRFRLICNHIQLYTSIIYIYIASEAIGTVRVAISEYNCTTLHLMISMHCALLKRRHMARSAPLGGAARGISEYCTGDLLYIALHVHQSTAVPAKFLSDQDQPTPLYTSRNS